MLTLARCGCGARVRRTLMEGWCAMQQPTNMGLRPAKGAEKRYTIACIHNSTEEFAKPMLIAMVEQRTPDEMKKLLAAPDVNLTNAKDKEIMLPVVEATNSRVISYFREGGEGSKEGNGDETAENKAFDLEAGGASIAHSAVHRVLPEPDACREEAELPPVHKLELAPADATQ